MENTSLQKAQHTVKTFAYQSFKSFHTSYKGWLTTYRNKQDLWDMVKIGTLMISALFFGVLFMYYINLASTRGYFMKLASQELNAIKAKNDIVKLEVIRKKRENWDNLYAPRTFSLQKNLITIEIPELSSE